MRPYQSRDGQMHVLKYGSVRPIKYLYPCCISSKITLHSDNTKCPQTEEFNKEYQVRISRKKSYTERQTKKYT